MFTWLGDADPRHQPTCLGDAEHRQLFANQDDCLIAITDGRPVPLAKLRALPPWRAVLIARVAARAGVMDQAAVDALVVEARSVSLAGAWRLP